MVSVVYPKTTEQIQDIISSLLVAGDGLILEYNDAGNTLTVSVDDAAFVPYSGATQNVDIGDYALSAARLTAKNPSILGPSPYFAAVNSLSNATLELRTTGDGGYTGLNLQSVDATGQYKIGGQTVYDSNRYSYPVRAYIGGSTGPFLDNSSGTIRARNNAGTADAPISASTGTFSGLLSGNTLAAGSTGQTTINSSGQLFVGGTQTTFGSAGSGRSYINTSAGLVLGSGLPVGWSSALDGGFAALDTAFSRVSAGVAALGNGTAGNASGKLNAAVLQSPMFQSASTIDMYLRSGSSALFGQVNSGSQTCFRGGPSLFSVSTLGIGGANSPTAYLSSSGAGAASLGSTSGGTDGALTLGSVTLSTGNLNFSATAQRINFLAGNTSTGTLDFYRTGDTSPIMQLTQSGASTAARFVAVRGEGINAQSEAGNTLATCGQYGIRVAQGVGFEFSSSTTNTSSVVHRIARDSTAATIDSRCDNGFRSRNFANSADAPFSASNITASGWIKFGAISLSADPTTLDLSSGQASLYKNTTSGSVKLWYNDSGTMKSVALT